jgi:S-DNA-T family DNA segregation ATPase FtsK/SpoIIIE
MLLTLVEDGVLSRLSLPEKARGKYWISTNMPGAARVNLIAVEGIDEQWQLKSTKAAWLVDESGESLKTCLLEPNRFYDLHVEATDARLVLQSEPSTEDRQAFSRYLTPADGTLIVGRSDGCDIRFASRFVSSRHAEIRFVGGDATVTDLGSSNGTFLNGESVTTSAVRPGDALMIMGLVIIFGSGFIALNNPDGLVAFGPEPLAPLVQQAPALQDDEIEDATPGERFYRSPRFKRDIRPVSFKIDSPPTPANTPDLPLAMVIGPAATMGLASVLTGSFAVFNVMTRGSKNIMDAMPMLVMSLSMMLGMVLWPILTRRYERRAKARREVERQEKYTAYLARTAERFTDESQRQTGILHENLVTLDDCVHRIRERERNLWERMIGHDDFLRVRLGLGDWPLDAEVKFAERTFSVDEDDLLDQMYELAEKPKTLHDVPISVSLRSQPVVGIIGERARAKEFLKGMIVQLAALHSYDELKLVFIFDGNETGDWDFVRLLPHTWAEGRSMRFVATNRAEAKSMTAYLEQVFRARVEAGDNEDSSEASPHYVVFALDRDLAGKVEFVRDVLKQEKNPHGFSVVALYDELRYLPKECRAVVQLEAESSRMFDKDDITGAHLDFREDISLSDDARELAGCLANTFLDTAESAFTLPNAITFLEMLGAGKVEHLNALSRWKESNPVLSLGAPVGVSATGETLSLDIHERYHGPHGLIAGMTGSGKSEFIMSYILSLAVNYHPDEIAFVLIDYKGGGMANAFADLPHVAGTITNLDGAAVNRALVSLQSELKRRQEVFNQASRRTGVSNIDIYKYQSLHRDGAVEEPLPHLLVISDEFAELKTQEPEFMTQLVSAARIGRSLGVHLILATQKPAGVVDDQIWSNSRFRVCLKVQEKADSMEVIKRADAAELSVTGRFYLQVGFNELFEMGQSAWAGAPYYPADQVLRARDDSVVLVDTLGQPIKQMKIDRMRQKFPNPSKQIDEVTRYLANLAGEEHIRTRPLWLPPIPARIDLAYLAKKYKMPAARSFVLDPLIGEYDDPANQQQNVLTFPLSSEGNAVIYGSTGSGKTEFLTTMLYSLIESHGPEEVGLYLVDLGSETLQAFAKAPQVGDVLLSQDAEKVHNLFKMLDKELKRRKKLFADCGGDYASYRASTGEQITSIVTVIHGFSAFSEVFGDLSEQLAHLSREGIRYGIYFVLTASGASEVRYQILQNFKQIYVLQFNDKTDYNGVLGKTGGVTPSAYKGRGIVRLKETVYEFQTAVLPTDSDVLEFIRRYSAEHASVAGSAPRIPILPEDVTPEYLMEGAALETAGVVPIGIDKVSLSTVTYDFGRAFVTPILSQDNDDMRFAQGLAEVLAMQIGSGVTVLDPLGTFAKGAEPADYTCAAGTDAGLALSAVFDEMTRRGAESASRGSAADTAARAPLALVIASFTALREQLAQPELDMLASILEKSDVSMGLEVIIFDAASNVAGYAYEPWAKRNLSTGTGIWLGNGISDQFVLKPATMSSDMYKEVGEGFGYVLAKGKARVAKLLVSAASASGSERE